MRKNVLFLCTGNSCRSQMAEGFAKKYMDNSFVISSGGVEAHGLNPRAVESMDEVGIDIRDQESSALSNNEINSYDLVITLCGDARDSCPNLGTFSLHIHWNIEDPAKYNDDKNYLNHFRRVRDEIESRIKDLIAKKENY